VEYPRDGSAGACRGFASNFRPTPDHQYPGGGRRRSRRCDDSGVTMQRTILWGSLAAIAVLLAGGASNAFATSPAITITGGNSQSATVSAAFAQTLSVEVTDDTGAPVPDATVTFSSPKHGASAYFDKHATATAETNSSGIASISAVADLTPGTYTVTASVSVSGTPLSTHFTETNTAPKLSSSIVPGSISESVHGCATFYYASNVATYNAVAVFGPLGRRWRVKELGLQRSGLHKWIWCGRAGTAQGGKPVPPARYRVQVAARMTSDNSLPAIASSSQFLTVTS
jgi:hypothetical protein